MASALWIIRVSILVLSLLISVAVLGLAANYVSKFSLFSIPGVISFSTPAFAELALATAAINILFIAPSLAIDVFRRGAFTSWIIIEIIVTFVVSALWLADAADTTSVNTVKDLGEFGLPQTCAGADQLAKDIDALEASNPAVYGYLKAIDFDSFGDLCRMHLAIEGLGYVAWVMLMGYSITLLIIAIVASVRGVPKVWTGTVRDTNLFASGSASSPSSEKVLMSQASATMGTPNSTPATAVNQQSYHAPNHAPGPHPAPYAGQV